MKGRTEVCNANDEQAASRVLRTWSARRITRTVEALSAVAALLLLASCEFLTGSPFPDYASLIETEKSVSKWFDGDTEDYYLTASADITRNRLFFSVEDGPAGSRIVVFDEDLDVERNFAVADLNSQVPPGNGTLGTQDAFTFVNAPVLEILIGNFVFAVDPDTGTLNPARDTTDPLIGGLLSDPFSDAVGRFEEGTTPVFRTYAFFIDNDTRELLVDEYDASWTLLASNNVPLGEDGEFRILDIFPIWGGNEPESFFLFLIGEEDEDRIRVVIVPYSDFPPTASDLLETAFTSGDFFGVYPSFKIKGVDPSRAHLHRDGIVCVGKDSDRITIHSFEDGDEFARLDMEQFEDFDIAVSPEADSFYLLDREAEKVFRLSNFW